MSIQHGIQIVERPTSIIAPVVSESAVQVVVGAAPINMTQYMDDPLTPKIAYSYDEAVAKMGMCSDFAAFPVCQSISASFEIYNVSPLIMINILDPTKHTTNIPNEKIDVDSDVLTLKKQGVILESIYIKSSDINTTYEQDKDYTLAFASDGTVNIVLKKDGNIYKKEASILLQYTMLDPSKILVQDVLNGIKRVEEIFPRFGIIPCTLIAPGWSGQPEINSALISRSENLNGCFRYTAIADIDTIDAPTYESCKEIKDKNGSGHPHCICVWPKVRNGDRIFNQSAILAAHLAYLDYINGGVPYVSPSNKDYRISGLCNEMGREIIIDMAQANLLNSFGIVSAINFNGWKCWGNRTSAYPSNNDVKDGFIPVRRMFNWWCNTFIQTYFSKVDDPMNRKLIEAIVDSERIRANAYKSQYQIADAGIEFRAEDNPDTDLISGILHLRMWLSPFPPAEFIRPTIEYDVSALKQSLLG